MLFRVETKDTHEIYIGGDYWLKPGLALVIDSRDMMMDHSAVLHRPLAIVQKDSYSNGGSNQEIQFCIAYSCVENMCLNCG